MKPLPVYTPAPKQIIYAAPGFEKKLLATHHAETGALCAFGCSYCSSNTGNYLRINREHFAALTEEQLGERLYPATAPGLTFVWREAIEVLDAQLAGKPKTWGAGKVLMFSQLTDAFAPYTLTKGPTLGMLERFLVRTSFRIRILTKSALVARDDLIALYLAHPGRFVVGLSIGTLDDDWAARVEIGTSSPTARVKALRKLQDAGVPTFGMLCPVFPDMLDEGNPRGLEALVDAIRPEKCEELWAEPFNDRACWQAVRAGYAEGSHGWHFLTDVYQHRMRDLWSLYATDLYVRLFGHALVDGWTQKLRYLLYEDGIQPAHAEHFDGMDGVLLQSKPVTREVNGKEVETGWSSNGAMRAMQRFEGDGLAGWKDGERVGWTGDKAAQITLGGIR